MKCTDTDVIEFFGGPKNANYFPFFSLFFLLSSVLLCHNIFCFFLISLLTGSLLISFDKGRLISEEIFLTFKSCKKQTKIFGGFLP